MSFSLERWRTLGGNPAFGSMIQHLTGGPPPVFPPWEDSPPVWADVKAAVDYFAAGDGSAFDETTSSILGTLSGTNKWAGGVLGPNGIIYGIPYTSTSILRIDPSTDSVTTFGSLGAGGKWSCGVLGPNGIIYGIPFSSTSVLRIDPSTDSVTEIGSLAGGGKWFGGNLGANGIIYGIPYNSTSILKIDTSTDTVSTIGSFSSNTQKWLGSVSAKNGSIYGIPFLETNVLKHNTVSITVPEDMVLARYWNTT